MYVTLFTVARPEVFGSLGQKVTVGLRAQRRIRILDLRIDRSQMISDFRAC